MGGGLRTACVSLTLLAGCTCAQSFVPDSGARIEPSIDAGAPAFDAGGGRDAGAPRVDPIDAGAPLEVSRRCEMSLDLGLDGTVERRMSWSYARDGRLLRREVDDRGLGRSRAVDTVLAWDARGEWTALERRRLPEGRLSRTESRAFHGDGRPVFHALANRLGEELWRDTWHYDADDLLVRRSHRELLEESGYDRHYEVDPRLETARIHGSDPEVWVVWNRDRIVEERVFGDLSSHCLRYEYGAGDRLAREIPIDCDSGDDLPTGAARAFRWDPVAGELRFELERDPEVAGWIHRNGPDGTWSESRFDDDWDGVVDGVWRVEGCGAVDGPPYRVTFDAQSLRLAGVPLSTRRSMWDPRRVP